MSTWKKIIVSGSDAHLSSVSASVSLGVNSNQRIGITQDLTRLTGSFTGSFVGNGSGLTNLNSDNLTLPTNAFGPIYSNDKFLVYNTGNGYVTLNDLLTQLAGTNLQNSGGTTLTLSSSITGLTSVTSTGFTGSLQGTASYSSTSVSSSYATTASYVLNSVSSSFATTASYYAGGVSISNPTDNRVITSDGTSTGLNGEVHLTFDGSTLLVVGNVDAQSFTGSLKGTATTASLAISSSYATTASYVLNSVSASFATTSTTSTTASYYGGTVTSASFATNSMTASYVLNAVSSSFATTSMTASYYGGTVTSASYAQTASYVINSISSSLSENSNLLGGFGVGSFAQTGSNTFNANQVISGSLTITQNLTVFGSSSLTYVTASQLAVSTSFISVNVFEPAQRFGGLIVYDSGSSQATASLAWDSQHNHWIYQNASDGGYSGGMFIAGPRNTGSLGEEPTLTTNFVPKSQGGDHITDSNISDNGTLVNINSNTTITGSLFVTGGITGSLQGTATTASYYGGTVTSASFASSASYFSGTVTSASFASTASFLSGTVTSASYAQTATTASYSYQQFANVETLSFNKTLTTNDAPIQILSTGGVTRTITLPTTGTPNGFKFEIVNNDAYTSTGYLTITPSDQHYIPAKCKATLYYDSANTTWVTDNARNIVLGGSNYSNYNGAIAIGFGNYSNYQSGIGIGNGSLGNYTYGVGIGQSAYYNYSYGIGIGYGTNSNYNNAIGIGYQASSNYGGGIGIGYGSTVNRDYGIGLGYQARYNLSYGIGIGYQSEYNDTYGIGIGYRSINAASYGISFGASTDANNKGTGTVAIGAYTKAERQNEFVTTATDSTTNKAQSIIQKFRNKALATSAGAFQEIFTDASSGRLTILASSIYQFRIQINAIAATSLICKTWEITGGIKRNGSNVTTIVGGAPTYYITSEDSGTGNWDVRVTANDTNEALKIEVKHDSANNVTFSATVWATETRL